MTEPDADLVYRVLDGDAEAFRGLVDRYRDRVVAAAYRMLGDAESAQDVAQEAFVESYRRLHKLRETHKYRQWLFGILHNRCLKQLRRRRFPFVSWEETDADSWYQPADGSPEAGDRLSPVVRRLRPEYRAMLAARYLEDMSYEEIARTMGLTEVNVRVRCHRAKQKLRELVAEYEAEQCRVGGAPAQAAPCAGGETR
jgi:RNA polymerase sigma-70 factor (ECF subfamily)